MTADEMFKNLGYKKVETDKYTNKYYKDEDNIFYFHTVGSLEKTITKTGEYDSYCEPITMQELKAINKKCEELGWLKEVEE